jgi:hypothetical protein
MKTPPASTNLSIRLSSGNPEDQAKIKQIKDFIIHLLNDKKKDKKGLINILADPEAQKALLLVKLKKLHPTLWESININDYYNNYLKSKSKNVKN